MITGTIVFLFLRIDIGMLCRKEPFPDHLRAILENPVDLFERERPGHLAKPRTHPSK